MRTPALVAALLLAAGATACGRDAPAPSRYDDPFRGVHAALPAGWHAAAQLTALTFPRELLTFASFPLRRGGSCGPTRALRDLGPRDALVTVLELGSRDGAHRRLPARPARLQLPRAAAGALECFGKPGSVVLLQDGRRRVQVVAILGARATPARRRAVERILDGVRLDPALRLERAPYLGVRCARANSLACDRAGLAVWIARAATRLTATIDGRSFALRRPAQAGGFWEGALAHAGFSRRGAALRVAAAHGGRWEGRDAPSVVVHLVAVGAGGVRAVTDARVTLRAGYG